MWSQNTPYITQPTSVFSWLNWFVSMKGQPLFNRTCINWVFPAFRQDPKNKKQCPNVKPTKEVVFLPSVCKVITTEDKGLHHCCGWHFWNPYQEGTKKAVSVEMIPANHWWFLGISCFFQKNLLFSRQFVVCAFGSQVLKSFFTWKCSPRLTFASDWEALLDFLHQQENLPRTAATLQGNWGQEGKRALQSYLKKKLGAILEGYLMILGGAIRVARDDAFSNQMRSLKNLPESSK